MSFTDKQERALARAVPPSAIRTRTISGKELTYIEGWYAVAQANRIFGLDGWDRETVEARCIQAREARGIVTAVYAAKVRLTVRTGDAVVVREGHGTGEAQGNSSGEAHDRALKTAETDATKRALATFGRAFGLALYAAGRPAASAKAHGRRVPQQAQAPAIAAHARASGPSDPVAPMSSAEHVPSGPDAVALRHNSDLALKPAELNSGAPTGSERSVAPLGAPTAKKAEAAPAAAQPARDRVAPKIDKSVLAFPELQRLRDKEHLRYVASQPCLLCSATPSDAHHLRFAQPRAMGRKVGDDFTVPLCRKHHRDLHESGNEAAWWHAMGIEPIEIARQLWGESATNRTKHQGTDGLVQSQSA